MQKWLQMMFLVLHLKISAEARVVAQMFQPAKVHDLFLPLIAQLLAIPLDSLR
jgi:hypothetical protein